MPHPVCGWRWGIIAPQSVSAVLFLDYGHGLRPKHHLNSFLDLETIGYPHAKRIRRLRCRYEDIEVRALKRPICDSCRPVAMFQIISRARDEFLVLDRQVFVLPCRTIPNQKVVTRTIVGLDYEYGTPFPASQRCILASSSHLSQ